MSHRLYVHRLCILANMNLLLNVRRSVLLLKRGPIAALNTVRSTAIGGGPSVVFFTLLTCEGGYLATSMAIAGITVFAKVGQHLGHKQPW